MANYGVQMVLYGQFDQNIANKRGKLSFPLIAIKKLYNVLNTGLNLPFIVNEFCAHKIKSFLWLNNILI